MVSSSRKGEPSNHRDIQGATFDRTVSSIRPTVGIEPGTIATRGMAPVHAPTGRPAIRTTIDRSGTRLRALDALVEVSTEPHAWGGAVARYLSIRSVPTRQSTAAIAPPQVLQWPWSSCPVNADPVVPSIQLRLVSPSHSSSGHWATVT